MVSIKETETPVQKGLLIILFYFLPVFTLINASAMNKLQTYGVNL